MMLPSIQYISGDFILSGSILKHKDVVLFLNEWL